MADSRIAVLIDVENISHQVVGSVLAELAAFGRLTVKRAYGDWTSASLQGWRTKLNEHAIAPTQTFPCTTGKNSSDVALVIDAMDLLHGNEVDAFAIVSSDSDFTRLCTRLRASGRMVYVVGEDKTPTALQQACDRFIRIGLLESSAADPPAPVVPAVGGAGHGDPSIHGDRVLVGEGALALPNLHGLLVRSISQASGDDGWVGLSQLGNYLRSASAAFDQRAYGYDKLIDLVEAQPFLVVDRTGPAIRVRNKGNNPRRPASKPEPAPTT